MPDAAREVNPPPRATKHTSNHSTPTPMAMLMSWPYRAVLIVVTLLALQSVFGLSKWTVILSALFLCYLPSYLDGSEFRVTPADGSKFSLKFALAPIWRKIFSWFPASLIVSDGVDLREGQYVFAVHPHGIMSLSHFLVMTDAVGFMSNIHPQPRRDLGASVIFRIPLIRELCLYLGTCDAGSRTACRILSSGYSMQLFPGGIAEQVCTNDTNPTIVARGRTGFVRLALSYDVPIVPVFAFGEDKCYSTWSFLQSFRRSLAKNLRIGCPLFFGSLVSLGLLPKRRPLTLVIGHPIWPEGQDLNSWKQRMEQARSEAEQRAERDGSTHAPIKLQPRDVSQDEVERMLERYVKGMEGLFEQHKNSQPGYENSTLRVLSAR